MTDFHRKTAESAESAPVRPAPARLWLWRLLLAAAAVAFLLLGLAQGDYRSVMEKAVRLCLECVGLG